MWTSEEKRLSAREQNPARAAAEVVAGAGAARGAVEDTTMALAVLTKPGVVAATPMAGINRICTASSRTTAMVGISGVHSSHNRAAMTSPGTLAILHSRASSKLTEGHRLGVHNPRHSNGALSHNRTTEHHRKAMGGSSNGAASSLHQGHHSSSGEDNRDRMEATDKVRVSRMEHLRMAAMGVATAVDSRATPAKLQLVDLGAAVVAHRDIILTNASLQLLFWVAIHCVNNHFYHQGERGGHQSKGSKMGEIFS